MITTNVDHQFQTAGFDKKRLFYTQGDYGLFQSVNPQIQKTYDNEAWVMEAMEAQGFVRDPENVFQPPQGGSLLMRIPTELIPKCPDDGSDVTMNLRSDDSFVEDEGWHRASAAYSDFLRRHENLHVLYLEIGIGMNTPVFYSMRTKGKSTRNAIKRQISEGSHTWICCKSQDVKQMLKGIRADCAGSIVYFDSMIGLYEYTVLEGEQVPPPRAPPPDFA